MTTPWGDVPNLPRGRGRFGVRNFMQTPISPSGAAPSGNPFTSPLRLSDIKYAVYGGLRFDRVLYAGWEFSPSIGMVAKDIDLLGLELSSFIEPLEAAIAYMSQSIAMNFAEEGRPDKWEELNEYSVKVRGSDHPILVRSGRLKDVATSFSIWTVTPTAATIRSLPEFVWYGALHQEGFGSLNNVARSILRNAVKEGADPRIFTPENVEKMAKALLEGRVKLKNPRQATKVVIPARPFIVFQDPEDIDAIQEIFVEWMEAAANRVGRNWNRL